MEKKNRIVRMKINESRWFKLPCYAAHKIKEILETKVDTSEDSLSYTIQDLDVNKKK